MPKKCCCVGHREIPQDKAVHVRERLKAEIEQAIKDGYEGFSSGFAEGTDRCFTAIVAEMKKDNKGLWLEADIPNRDELDKLEIDAEAQALLNACDSIACMQDERFKEIKGAHFLVQECGRVIAVYDGRERGNTALAVQHAKELGRDLRIIDI